MAGSFSAKISAWVAETKARQVAVFRESAERVISAAQTPGPSVANPGGGRGGNMPIATGFLRASGVAILNGGMPAAREHPGGETYSFEASAVSLVISGAQLSDVITFAYTAAYARHVEHRYQFVGLAAQRWPQIVAEVCREAKGRAGS